jgi:hypothetical protein
MKNFRPPNLVHSAVALQDAAEGTSDGRDRGRDVNSPRSGEHDGTRKGIQVSDRLRHMTDLPVPRGASDTSFPEKQGGR